MSRIDFINSSGKSAHCIYRLINPIRFCHRGEDFAGFRYCDRTFLSDIVLFYGYNSLRSVHFKRHRFFTQHITVCGALFDQFIISVLQGLRQHEFSGSIGVESIDIHRCGVVDVLGDPFSGISISHFETDSCSGDDFTGFSVFLDDLDECFKSGIVYEITINLAVLIHEHIECRHQLCAFCTFGLFYHIYAIWQFLRLGKAVFIAHKEISFRFLCIFITACAFQINFECRTFFRCLDLCGAIVMMLDDCNFSFSDCFRNIQCSAVIFDFIQFRFCTYMIDFGVQKVSFTWF